MIKKRKLYAAGGEVDPLSLLMSLGSLNDAMTTNSDGSRASGGNAMSGILKGAGVGAKFGSVVPGVGTLAGGAIGGLVGGIGGSMQQAKMDKLNAARITKEREAERIMQNQQEAAQKLNYDTGTSYTSMYANGGTMNTVAPLKLFGKTSTNNTNKLLPLLGIAGGMAGLMALLGKNKGNPKAALGSGIPHLDTTLQQPIGNNEPWTVVDDPLNQKTTEYAAKGGKLPFTLLNDNVIKVKGKKHEQGGVKIGNAEVEKGEVIKGNKVFSDRLKVPGSKNTYADVAERITRGPMYKTLARNYKEMERVSQNPKVDQYRAGTAARNLEKTIQPLDRLFNMQEASKTNKGIGRLKYALGGTLDGPGDRYVVNKDDVQNGYVTTFDPVENQYYMRLNSDKKEILMNDGNVRTDSALKSIYGTKSLESAPPDFGLRGKDRLMDKDYGKSFYNMSPNTIAKAAEQDALDSANNTVGLTNPATTTSTTTNTVVDPGLHGTDRSFPFNGKKVLNKFGEVVPYLDNITNAILTSKSPQVPVPRMEVTPTLKTKFNIQPQLANIDRIGQGVRRSLKDNSTGGGELRASLISRGVQDINAKNDLLGQKENIETEMKNKQAVLSSDTANRNASTLNQFDLRKFGRAADIQTRVSQNVANLTEDMQQKIIDNKLDTNDQQSLALIYKKYSKSGVLDRAKLNEMRQLISSGKSADEAMKILAEKEGK